VRPDLVAGLTVWAVLVPEALAYATIAGVPPVVGLYAAVPALVLYALVGSSRHLVVAPMSATAALSARVIATVAPAGDASSTRDLRLVVLDGRATPSVDVTAASMLVPLRDDVDRLGGCLVLAGHIGQVREVLALAESREEPPPYPTIDAALPHMGGGRALRRRGRATRGTPRSAARSARLLGDPSITPTSPDSGDAPRRTAR
jgi:hypothetical protein